MFTLAWRFSAAIHHILQRHAASNRLAAEIRRHRRPQMFVLAGIAALTYLALAVLAKVAADPSGAAWFHGVAGLLTWNSLKLGWVAIFPVGQPEGNGAQPWH